MAYYFKSLEIEKSGSRFEEIALRLVFIGNLYVKKQQNDSAIVYFNEALKIGKQKNIDEILAIPWVATLRSSVLISRGAQSANIRW